MDHSSLRGFKTNLKTHLFSQCHAAPQITVILLELWRYTNYTTYLLTYYNNNNNNNKTAGVWLEMATELTQEIGKRITTVT